MTYHCQNACLLSLSLYFYKFIITSGHCMPMIPLKYESIIARTINTISNNKTSVIGEITTFMGGGV